MTVDMHGNIATDKTYASAIGNRDRDNPTIGKETPNAEIRSYEANSIHAQRYVYYFWSETENTNFRVN